MRILVILCLFILTSCDEAKQEGDSDNNNGIILTKALFSDLPDWGNDDAKDFTVAFLRSCKRILKKPSNEVFGVLKQAGTYGDWQILCSKFTENAPYSPYSLHLFFETYFTPYLVSAGNNPIGLFTGYYEASLNGSRIKKPPYIYPLHKRPDDLIMVQLGDFREGLKGERIAGRVVNGRLKPYDTRADIISGNWLHNHDEQVLLWVDDAVDAFFVQIQGSGVVQMDNGSIMRIGYDGQNGHPYYAIGRELIKIGALTKENVSMQSIRKWLEDNPAHASEIMNSNKSYVFFREIIGEGPLGAEGVALTAGRSLAVDRTVLSYGLPLWVDIEKPSLRLDLKANNIRRLMVAQDTGGAIRGAVRGDIFWGYGEGAENIAGQMKSKGRYWLLLPKRQY